MAESERHMVAAGLQTFLPGGVELTARLSALNNTSTQHVKIEIKGRDNRKRQEGGKVIAAAQKRQIQSGEREHQQFTKSTKKQKKKN